MKYFDSTNNRLLFIKEQASPRFWDQLWNKERFEKFIRKHRNDWFVSRTTKKYLTPERSCRILEGGCGRGQYVYSLAESGYDAFGVDFAPKTVERTKESFPHLKISYGDVRHLEFPDRFFDGYWSLGVIEHFYEGYRPILEEMGRVLKPGGYLFLTFPCLSLLRRLKARLGLYPEALGTSSEKEHFYQFALDPAGVMKDLREVGFRVVRTQKLDGVKGLKDEVPVLKGFLQKLYDSSNPLIRLARGGLSLALAPFSNHSILIILKRND